MAELQLLERTAGPKPIVGTVPAPSEFQDTGLSPALVAHLLRQVAVTPIERIQDLVPALRLLVLIAASAAILRLTAITLDALDGFPLVGGLCQLLGLVSLLAGLSREALRQQKRAELMVRIEQLRRSLHA